LTLSMPRLFGAASGGSTRFVDTPCFYGAAKKLTITFYNELCRRVVARKGVLVVCYRLLWESHSKRAAVAFHEQALGQSLFRAI
jgi:hypothetical protein